MNKTRIIGLAAILLGIIIQFYLKNDITGFISGILIGGGIGFLFASKFNNTIS
ncbi:hypothetical protein [Tenacibaculum insulae]|uniref:hypothetical protein n=1 Tax=Tenacibaculum insulae TaxID=2029677 RepID=UPI003AB53882